MSPEAYPTLRKKRFRFTQDDAAGYLFIFFAVAIYAVFTIYPLISAVITSFQKYKPFGSEWVAWKNYKDTLHNELFWKALKNTAVYTVVTIPLSLLIAFCIAILIVPFRKRTQSLFKSIYYIPAVASGVALSVVWLWIYNSSPAGLANQIIGLFGADSLNWLASSKTAMLSLIIMALLSGQGQNIIIYIAALLSIDNSYFEAAEIDGATFMQKVRFIVWPLCKPTTLFLLVTGIIGSFQVFMNSYMMTGGGPDNNTTMVGLLIFNNAFVYGKYGIACAQAVLLTIIIALLTAVQFKISGDDVEY